MKILGICGGIRLGNWDAAAALVVDGKVVAAAEEERFTRVKHAPGNLPTNAVNFCLAQGRLDIRDLDLVVFPGSTYVNMRERLTEYFGFVHGHKPAIELCDHHQAHAASAYFTSGLPDALVVTFDFSGDRQTTTVSHAIGTEMRLLQTWKYPQSLGLYYAMVTQFLGFDFGEDEYKVMGLASYGRPTIDLGWMLKSLHGSYELEPGILRRTGAEEPPLSPQERLFSPELERRLGPARSKGSPIDAFHQDVAASAQYQLERVVRDLVAPFRTSTGSKNLCLAGGVAMNCVMVQTLAKDSGFERVHLSPVSGDAGLALGAALLFTPGAVQSRHTSLATAALGPSYSNAQVLAAISEVGATYRETSDPMRTAAEAIAEGKIVGWYQGRMEYGARALGHRSILADPRRAEMKDRVNAVVKFREGFRPFAPSVTREGAGAYFEEVSDCPFMTSTFTVRPEMRSTIPAVTHVDGTARVQTVSAEAEPEYHRLVQQVGEQTGVPIVLNTSFNIKGQPIVESPNQAISTYFGSGLDMLIAGSFVLQKR